MSFYYVHPSGDFDRYAAGYDDNWFTSVEEAEAACESLENTLGPGWVVCLDKSGVEKLRTTHMDVRHMPKTRLTIYTLSMDMVLTDERIIKTRFVVLLPDDKTGVEPNVFFDFVSPVQLLVTQKTDHHVFTCKPQGQTDYTVDAIEDYAIECILTHRDSASATTEATGEVAFDEKQVA